ncbi:MAG: 3-hydroxybenzoate 4-monooxygenase, partial [Pseudomonadota bacterium]|nr:3-hydroxybenzoate 4-monooxygenase [Pseudomonadota bacterium]MEC8538430.1 3-hydroxybenzoate 4-monooxygenase [Pseudomonadota bacterium]MEC9226543.1 3-hydroxybenzoate 4-monooxygenase [Pseudomonadota bacterium]
ASPLVRHAPADADIDAVIDVRAVLQQGFREIDMNDLPALLRPAKGTLGLTDYEKAFCPDLKNGPDIFDLRGIDRGDGAIVIIRPDQYVADVMPLDGFDRLAAFFGGVMLPHLAS